MIARILVALLVGVLFAPSSALAQEESPSPPTENEECQVGELCTNVNTEQGPTQDSAPINDPPGDVRTSLLTMVFIALVVGTYLFIALTGRSLSRLVRIPGRRS